MVTRRLRAHLFTSRTEPPSHGGQKVVMVGKLVRNDILLDGFVNSLMLIWGVWAGWLAAPCEYGSIANFAWSADSPSFCLGESLSPALQLASANSPDPGLRRLSQDGVEYTVGMIPSRAGTTSAKVWIVSAVFGERIFKSRDAALSFAATQFELDRNWEMCQPMPGRRTSDCYRRRRLRMTDVMSIEESYAVYGPAKTESTKWTLRYGKAIKEGLR